MRAQHSHTRRMPSRTGATLLVTLGILAVLSVLAITFFVASRLERQSVAQQQHRLAARNHIDEGIFLAMKFVEESLTYPNYASGGEPDGQYLTRQRLAPVNDWFGRDYALTNNFDHKIAFQTRGVLASPTVSNATVNLLSPAVLSLIPSSLTNGLNLSRNHAQPFRSGWQPLALPGEDSATWQLHTTRARVAFAVFDCSGLIDANHFLSGPSAQKTPRQCFSQGDVTNWTEAASVRERLDQLKINHDPAATPFSHLSYDPGPDIYPLHYDCFETCGSLGLHRFGAGPTINLNAAGYYKAMAALKENALYWKFNINSLTNHFLLGSQSTEAGAPWFNHAQFRANWLDPTVFLLEMMRHEEPDTTRYRWPDSTALAWSIANFMDADRIPQVSGFPTEDAPEPVLATRADYAVENVPLINKVTVFNIYDDDEELKSPQKPDYYELPSDGRSNHYAVAVELWYPFAPNPPHANDACYVGIYTNAADVVTTTNRPWSDSELRDWFDWNNVDSSNSVMRTLFYSWAQAYTREVGAALDNHPLWQTVTNQGALWFTPAMTNHPSWPAADTNGAFSIADTPIWQAFYPDTYEVVSTNTAGVVTTNVFTYVTVTNSYVEWVSDADGSVNRLVRPIGTTSPTPYPVLLWSNLTTSAFSTNVLGAFLTPDASLIPFATPGMTNHLLQIAATPGGIDITYSNELSAAVQTVAARAFVLAAWSDTNDLIFASATNLYPVTEITPVAPLPMPDELGQSLSALLLLLPDDSLGSLYDFLLLTPDQIDLERWQSLLDYFNENPSIINRLLPSHQEPTLGNMTEKDRHLLWPEDSGDETVKLDPDYEQKLQPGSFQGYFWTVYPKQTVSFMEVIEEVSDGSGTITQPAATNYHPIGAHMTGHERPNTVWLRPAVTVRRETGSAEPVEDLTENDIIVDEALLSHDTEAGGIPVWGWTAVTNLYIPDPRRNAYARNWRGFPADKQWIDSDVFNTTNLSTEVSEYPFIHFNGPFSTVGDIGHIYASYKKNRPSGEESGAEGEIDDPARQQNYDTLTFSTRAGAALLDIFTLSAANAPRRGLVQANTQHAPVIQALLSDIPVGWTNILDGGAVELNGLKPVNEDPSRLEGLASVYLEALTNAPLSMGWRSFADMMPNLSTNELLRQSNLWQGSEIHPGHNYVEDVLRGLVDKVSFRQNIFVVIVAAQTLSPGSTDAHAVVLSDQRAAVTIIRDAYTGRWTVHSWVWLTE